MFDPSTPEQLKADMAANRAEMLASFGGGGFAASAQSAPPSAVASPPAAAPATAVARGQSKVFGEIDEDAMGPAIERALAEFRSGQFGDRAAPAAVAPAAPTPANGIRKDSVTTAAAAAAEAAAKAAVAGGLGRGSGTSRNTKTETLSTATATPVYDEGGYEAILNTGINQDQAEVDAELRAIRASNRDLGNVGVEITQEVSRT